MKNETDGFMATVLEPHISGLTVYMVFNCYGMNRSTLIPKKHRKMVVEIAKDKGGDNYKRFDWRELIPVDVSESPRILLRGKRLKRALSLFSQQEWDDIYCFIKMNSQAIQHHWTEPDSIGLFEGLKKLNGDVVLPKVE